MKNKTTATIGLLIFLIWPGFLTRPAALIKLPKDLVVLKAPDKIRIPKGETFIILKAESDRAEIGEQVK